ncbi:hypothetical protein [Cupriavidus necator]
MKMISPAELTNADTLEYRAKGSVMRVFDESALGDLLPVEYQQLSARSKFRLQHVPAGKVWAEVEVACQRLGSANI